MSTRKNVLITETDEMRAAFVEHKDKLLGSHLVNMLDYFENKNNEVKMEIAAHDAAIEGLQREITIIETRLITVSRLDTVIIIGVMVTIALTLGLIFVHT